MNHFFADVGEVFIGVVLAYLAIKGWERWTKSE